MGGGALMTPILIIFLHVPPLTAVGTDLAYAAITKAFGGFVHWRQRTVDTKLALSLAAGSVPAAILGVIFVYWLGSVIDAEAMNQLIQRLLGIALLIVAATLLLRPFVDRHSSRQARCVAPKQRPRNRTILLGAFVGFLVGVTSVGSGTLVIVALLLFYPYLAMMRVVGTDVYHGAILVSAAALAHGVAGNVNFPLMLNLLIGSLPGVFIGSKLSVQVPEKVLRPVLVTILAASGLKLF